MTPTEISTIADRHLQAWFAEDPATSKLTLRSFVEQAITEALEKQAKECAAGDATRQHEADALIDSLQPEFIVEGRYAGNVRLVIGFRGDDYAAIKAAQDRILKIAGSKQAT